MQLWKRLSANVANHVHGMFRQKVEPGLCQGQEVFCLLLWLQENIASVTVFFFLQIDVWQ